MDVMARLSKVEGDVALMKGQIGQMGPVLEKMPALQDKLGELVTELQRIDQRVASARAHADKLEMPPAAKLDPAPLATPSTLVVTPIPQPVEKPAPTKALKAPLMAPIFDGPKSNPVSSSQSSKSIPLKAATPPKGLTTEAKKTDGVVVRNVRLGQEPNRTRLVLDVSQKTNFAYDLDNSEKIMIVEVDAKSWVAAPGASFGNSDLIAGYTSQSLENGRYRLIVQLKKPVKVLSTTQLPPNGDKSDRVVIDLASL
jgi:hypothetical protein